MLENYSSDESYLKMNFHNPNLVDIKYENNASVEFK